MTGNIATKAAVYGEQNATYTAKRNGNYELFRTYAKYTAATGDNPQTSGTEFFPGEGVVCEHRGSGTSDYWAPNPTYYWPFGGYLSFHAFSPSDLSPFSGTVTHDWSNGFTITNFKAGNWQDNYRNNLVDILYSDFIFKKQRSEYSPVSGVPYDEASEEAGFNHKGVNVTFHHALAGVQFRFKTDADYSAGNVKYTFKTTQIDLQNLNYKGEFHENRTNAANNSFGNAPDGSITANNDNTTIATPYWIPVESDEFSNAIKVSGLETTITHEAQNVGSMMLIMPQNLNHSSTGHKVKLKITYTFEYQVGTEAKKSYSGLTKEIELAGLTGKLGGADYTINQWLINHKYTYTLTFKLDPLIFDPKVEVWVNVEDINVDLPYQS